MTDQTDILKLRRRLALEIAEQIELTFHLQRSTYDVDRAALLIDSQIPLSRDEALLEYDQEDRLARAAEQTPPPSRPTLIDQLRDELRLTRTKAAPDVLRATIARLRWLEAEVAGLSKQVEGHCARIADQSELLARRAEKDRAIEILRLLEWSASIGIHNDSACPYCRGKKPVHLPRCELAALLGKEQSNG